jgi:hypothetical protein
MVEYPDSLPTDAVLVIIDRLRGKQIENAKLILAAWNLTGYALSQVTKENKPIIKSEDPREDSDDADLLESVLAMSQNPTGEAVAKAVIPWVLVLKIATRILLSVLA